jgi:hypothetical protein
MIVSIFAAGFQSQAATCRRFVITILDDPYFAHPICTDLPVPLEVWNAPPGSIHLGDGIRPIG